MDPLKLNDIKCFQKLLNYTSKVIINIAIACPELLLIINSYEKQTVEHLISTQAQQSTAQQKAALRFCILNQSFNSREVTVSFLFFLAKGGGSEKLPRQGQVQWNLEYSPYVLNFKTWKLKVMNFPITHDIKSVLANTFEDKAELDLFIINQLIHGRTWI